MRAQLLPAARGYHSAGESIADLRRNRYAPELPGDDDTATGHGLLRAKLT